MLFSFVNVKISQDFKQPTRKIKMINNTKLSIIAGVTILIASSASSYFYFAPAAVLPVKVVVAVISEEEQVKIDELEEVNNQKTRNRQLEEDKAEVAKHIKLLDVKKLEQAKQLYVNDIFNALHNKKSIETFEEALDITDNAQIINIDEFLNSFKNNKLTYNNKNVIILNATVIYKNIEIGNPITQLTIMDDNRFVKANFDKSHKVSLTTVNDGTTVSLACKVKNNNLEECVSLRQYIEENSEGVRLVPYYVIRSYVGGGVIPESIKYEIDKIFN